MRKFSKLIDNYNRIHDYLRISLTEKCNLNCFYCMPNKHQHKNETIISNVMKSNEILFLANYFCHRGIRKIRFTGGEPLLRTDFLQIIKSLNKLKYQHKHFTEIGMTTNGVKFKQFAEKLKTIGLNSVNISLDSLKSERILQLTGQATFKHTMVSIIKAVDLGYESVKVNCVVIKGFNDDELCDFVELTRYLPIEVRFIEFMPFDGNNWEISKLFSYKKC
ncbi:Molybdenum cofactor biosynthesis protein 1 [Schistosoma japonicum]|nr:Molybdenum cofactor biosynthesis protein 1 [Schistosoma japonicum]